MSTVRIHLELFRISDMMKILTGIFFFQLLLIATRVSLSKAEVCRVPLVCGGKPTWRNISANKNGTCSPRVKGLQDEVKQLTEVTEKLHGLVEKHSEFPIPKTTAGTTAEKATGNHGECKTSMICTDQAGFTSLVWRKMSDINNDLDGDCSNQKESQVRVNQLISEITQLRSEVEKFSPHLVTGSVSTIVDEIPGVSYASGDACLMSMICENKPSWAKLRIWNGEKVEACGAPVKDMEDKIKKLNDIALQLVKGLTTFKSTTTKQHPISSTSTDSSTVTVKDDTEGDEYGSSSGYHHYFSYSGDTAIIP